MPALPVQVQANAASGSQWVETYTLQNDDGTLMTITGKTFEFSIRPTVNDTSPSPLVKVVSTGATAQGYITVNTTASTVQVVLSPTATTLLGQGARPYMLWMDPGLSDQLAVVEGTFYSHLVAAP